MPNTPIATRIVDKLQKAGYLSYFAGGWVRDFIMKKPSDDIDIVTSASVEEIQKIFPKTIPVGIAFGIVIVVEEGIQFEVATFRQDEGYSDGRRPSKVIKASPEEDAQRRDFTINGMFYDPISQTLFDFVGGQKDLQKGIIRAIGNPQERFLEDRLRMMRAVRYSTRFNFPIESDTLQAILAQAETLLPAVAHERIWQEFKKMSQYAHFNTGLVVLHKLNLLPTIFPVLKGIKMEEIQQRVACISYYPPSAPPIAELLELFPNFSLDAQLQICEYLKLSNQEKDFVRYLYELRQLIKAEDDLYSSIEPISWAKIYANSFSETSLLIIASKMPLELRDRFLSSHLKRRQLLEQAILRIHSQSPLVRSTDLIELGVAPGIKMGKLLKEAERISVNEGLENRIDVLKQLKNSPLWMDGLP
ncbi:MAG: CCA tRNA nucleotidyltransferase [Chlamydiae bacterium]|nr:CCA tRNA nucleotidyltransferase [Chlamydiota bacterium]